MMLHWITCWTALTYSPVFCDHRMKLLTQIGHERDTIAGGGKKKESLKKTSGWEINTVSASLHGHGSTDSFKWGSLQDKWVGGSPGKTVLLPPASSHEISAAVCHGLGERLYPLLHPNSISIPSSVCLWMTHHSSQMREAALLEAHEGPAAGDSWLHWWEAPHGSKRELLVWTGSGWWRWLRHELEAQQWLSIPNALCSWWADLVHFWALSQVILTSKAAVTSMEWNAVQPVVFLKICHDTLNYNHLISFH